MPRILMQEKASTFFLFRPIQHFTELFSLLYLPITILVFHLGRRFLKRRLAHSLMQCIQRPLPAFLQRLQITFIVPARSFKPYCPCSFSAFSLIISDFGAQNFRIKIVFAPNYHFAMFLVFITTHSLWKDYVHRHISMQFNTF